MQTARVFERAFKKIYGKPCWGIRPGHGSFLTIEFGKPHLVVREPIVGGKHLSPRVREGLARRIAYASGEWHLFMYCCQWEVLSKGKRVADSSTKIKMRPAADILNGQKLIRFSIWPRKLLCIFEFDLGGTLKTRPYDADSEQWFLFEPSHKVLHVRADGKYSYKHDNVPRDDGQWKPIEIRAS